MKENVTHTLGVTLNIYATGTTGTEQNGNKKKLHALTLSVCLFAVKRSCMSLFSCVGNEHWNRTRGVVI